MLPTSVTLGLLLLVTFTLGYLIGHKKGLREGIKLREAFNKPPPPPPKEDTATASSVPSLEVSDPDRIFVDKYSVYRGGVIFRGGLEIAIIDESSPFEFDKLHGVQELSSDFEHCRRLSRLWFEKFGVDAGVALCNRAYFVSKSGLFWKGDFILGRLGSQFEFEKLSGSPEFYLKPGPEDVEICEKLSLAWKAEFLPPTAA